RQMTGEIFGARVALLRRQEIAGVDHHDLAEIVGEPLRGFEPAAGGRFFIGHDVSLSALRAYTNAKRTRRFCLPFFSICVTRTAPISPTFFTCVPPQGCRSRPAIS